MSHNSNHSHIVYYIILGIILFSGFFISQRVKEVFIVLPALYAIVAIIHHAASHTLTAKVVVEYVLIAALGGAVFLFLLLSGGI